MRPLASPILSRALSTGLVSAGLFAAILGATGATAQQGSKTPEPITTPAATAIAEATPTVSPILTPAATAEDAPAVDVQAATPTASAAPSTTADASPAPSPDDTATPDATPQETSTPDSTPQATPDATPGAEPSPRARPHRRGHERPAATPDEAPTHPRECPPGSVARKPKPATAEPAKLSTAFPKASTSRSRCEKRKRPHRRRHRGKRRSHDKPGETVATPPKPAPVVRPDGSPALANPTFTVAQPGPARIGVPNFFIEKFRIPPFLLPIYQAAGIQYGIRWEVLAAINEIETDYGRNLNVSSAGALGWMQFMPATWKLYGVDANQDGLEDPYNPADAIFASARYLRAAGGDTDIRRAVFAYNHANWYVDSVLMRARLIGGLPVDFVGSLTGLTQGRFPIHARATYAGGLVAGKRTRRVKQGNAAFVVGSDPARQGIDVFSREHAPVVAVNDGRVVAIGQTARLGRFVRLQDTFGNTYTYGHLGKVAKTYPAPRERHVTQAHVRRELDLPRDAKPTRSATAGRPTRRHARRRAAPVRSRSARPAAPTVRKQRLFAHPSRTAARRAGGVRQLAPAAYRPAADDLVRFDRKSFVARPLRKGARVIGGTILGRLGDRGTGRAPHLHFEIRPAGRGAPRVDPKPILDGWKLLETTAVYRAAGKNPFSGDDADAPTIGQILLMSKEALERRVLENPRIDLYGCGREDIRAGSIDRRVLATLEFLAASGLRPTVSSLRCGHGFLTASGNVSEHSSGDAVDIAAVNGVPIVGHQGKGSITETTIRRLLTLQGTMKPHQIISLMTFKGAENTFAMGDHDDHIHIGWHALYAPGTKGARRVEAILKPKQWIKLIDRLGEIDNPEVEAEPSKYALASK